MKGANELVKQASAVDEATIRPEWLRLPKPRGRCPFSGLSRTTQSELTVPSEKNQFRPPVHSIVIKQRGASRGIRLINYKSLMTYLASLGETPDTSEVQEP